MRPARNVYDRCRKVAMIKVTDDGAAANNKKKGRPRSSSYTTM